MTVSNVNVGFNTGDVTSKKVSAIPTVFTQKLSADEVKEIRAQIAQNSNAFTFNSTTIQSSLLTSSPEDKFAQEYQDFQSFLQDIGYSGKNIADLSQEEAADLVSEDGFFGIKQTAQRIANFVINGANGDEDLLRAGREGMLQGFKEAEDVWGSKLPDISQKTMKLATQLVDNAMHDLGYSIINTEA